MTPRLRHRRRTRTPLERVEPLEPRALLSSLTYNGGALLDRVELEGIYWGSAWSSNANLQADQAQIESFLRFIPSSGYMDLLNEYRVGRGTYVGSRSLTGVSETGVVDDSTIQATLNTAISQGTLDAPTSQRLYMIYMPENLEISTGNANSFHDFLGYHSAFTDSRGQNVYYAVIAHPIGGTVAERGLSAFEQQTEVSSHELAEAATDPIPGQGWYDFSGQQTSTTEVGDKANLQYASYNGFVVQAEWSNVAGKAVFANGGGGLATWLSTSGYLHGIVAGYGGVFGFDGRGQVWGYRDGQGWTATGGYGKAISLGQDAAGNNEVWLLAANNGVWRYDAGSWSFSGGYLSSIVAGFGEVYGLDGRGEVWALIDGVGWQETHGYARTLTLGTDVQGNDELWIQDQRGEIWRYEAGSWFATGGYLSTIDAGFNGEVFGLDYRGQAWLYNDELGWRSTGGYGTQIAVGSDGFNHDELWIRDGRGQVWRFDASGWFATGGYLSHLQAGYREVFGLDGTGQLWGFCDDTGWVATRGYGKDLVVGTDGHGGNEVWLRAGDDAIWRYDVPISTSGGGGGGGASAFVTGVLHRDPSASAIVAPPDLIAWDLSLRDLVAGRKARPL